MGGWEKGFRQTANTRVSTSDNNHCVTHHATISDTALENCAMAVNCNSEKLKIVLIITNRVDSNSDQL